ncbi:protein kinase [Microbulbifer sp. OS29]|uniref:Protein kinase n=1 Tax=Microbulbifer okhotskensis TaxID=2926617 RepID=A0A9X2EJV7_9GAMM|nr:serine/threonine-protein kinase [Microbulbifer okhotskensis]MCO1333572.1 protein kinase [Microbulbifer okhotskensis]
MSVQPPSYIGHYKILGQLGAGGMGVVYLAKDERLNRQVAIKRLLKGPADESASRRIHQEALLLAQLNHNNIVQIYDVVEEQSDVALVMEYVDGRPLTYWAREFNPNLRQKVQLLKQIATGLARAHAAGIIHRDLKADNILIDSNNIAKIADFGIARSWQDTKDLTREHHVAGSWYAMSPEQALGEKLDSRCDLFALGMLAYHLLCGQSPFGKHGSPYVIIDRIINSPHPPVGVVNPGLPAALCKLLDKLLAKTPDKRPVSAASVAADFEVILSQLTSDQESAEEYETTITTEDFHVQQRRKNKGRKLVAGILLASCAVLLGLTAAVFPQLSLPGNKKPSGKYIAIIEPNLSNLHSREERLLANNLLSSIKQGLSDQKALLLVPYSESQQLKGRPLREQAQALNAQLLLQFALNCEAALCEASFDLIETEDFVETASRSTMLNLDAPLESRARVLQQLHYLLPSYPAENQGTLFSLSPEDYQRYLEVFEQRNNEADVAEAIAEMEALLKKNAYFPPYYELLADLLVTHFYHSRDSKIRGRLEELLDNIPAKIANHPTILVTKVRIAIYLADTERTEALLAKLKLLLPDQALYYFLRAGAYQRGGAYSRALEVINQALNIRTSPIYLRQKAMTLTLMGQMEKAKPHLLQAIHLNNHYIDAISLLAANELDSGRPGESIRLLSQLGLQQLGDRDTFNLCLSYYIEKRLQDTKNCLAHIIKRVPKDPHVYLLLAEIARLENRPVKSQEFAQRALTLAQEQQDWLGLLLRARAYSELGQGEQAIEALLKIDNTAPDGLFINYSRAQVYMASGDMLSAKAYIRKTLELGMAPVWFTTIGFQSICTLANFDDLRVNYPTLCSERTDVPTIENNSNRME